MKVKSITDVKYRMLIEILVRILVVFTVCTFLLWLIDGPLNDTLTYGTLDVSKDIYYFAIENKMQILFILLIVALGIVLYPVAVKYQHYLILIMNSIDKVFKKDEELVALPKEFGDIENQLNSIKFESLRNEQIAKEAEQRKNDLVVYLAHDLKTPLTSVIGYLTLLHEELQISPELQKKYLGISIEKAERLEELINEFFEITRFNLQNITLEKSRLNLSLMLHQLVDEFYPLLAPKYLSCTMQVPEELYILGDANKLERVFDNILRNAIHYCSENSQINIEVGQSEGNVLITFQNTGSQIPEQKLQHIFEKFYRLDSARSSQTGGAGLGLAIAKEIVELHHGTIIASSDEQHTEFVITLPSYI